jgi:hypothetical protein
MIPIILVIGIRTLTSFILDDGSSKIQALCGVNLNESRGERLTSFHFQKKQQLTYTRDTSSSKYVYEKCPCFHKFPDNSNIAERACPLEISE